jgi:glucosamine--fructose-6-phosphate aminotransferase (isomerizing)
MTANQTWMLTEIEQTAEALARQLAGNAAAFASIGARLRTLNPPFVTTIARGSSDHCALYLKYLIEVGLGVPCASLGPSIASLYHAPLKLGGALSIAISQSGQSPDIVEMQRAAKRGGALTLAFVNEMQSPLAEEAELLAPLCAGPERSVAATKSMIAGLVAGASLVAAWRQDADLGDALSALPDALRGNNGAPPRAMVETLAGAKSLFVLGRGATFALAMEAALKLKETCAIHAEAFSSAEVLHGPAELVGEGFPVLAFMPRDAARDGMIATLDRLSDAGAKVLRVESGGADDDVTLGAAPSASPWLAPIPMIHRFYRLAEAVARKLGRDPDRPRNLRKVTETI